MTEDELQKMRTDLKIDSLLPQDNYKWCVEQLPEAKKVVSDLKSAFNLYQFIRNDERLQEITKQLKSNQSMLDYLEKCIKDYEEFTANL